jgi:hypothetical protein
MTVHWSHTRGGSVVMRLWSSNPARGHIDVTETEMSDVVDAVDYVCGQGGLDSTRRPADKLIARTAAKISIDLGIILGMAFVYFTSGTRHEHPGVLMIGLAYCLSSITYTVVTACLRLRRRALLGAK